MAKPVPISEVKKDHSPIAVKTVYNPLTYDFVYKFDGEPQKLPSGKHTQFPENVAVHLAKHLAKVIVTKVATDEREEILKGLDKNEAVKVKMKPFPRFNLRVGDVAKMLVMGSRDEKIVKTADVLNAAAEVKKGDKVVKTTEEVTFVDDENEPEAPTQDTDEDVEGALTLKTNAELKEIIATDKLAEDIDLSKATKKELVGIIMES